MGTVTAYLLFYSDNQSNSTLLTFPRNKVAKIKFVYDRVQIVVVTTQKSSDPMCFNWGPEGREVPLKYWEGTHQRFLEDYPSFVDDIEVKLSGATSDDNNVYLYVSDVIGQRSFISNLMMGEFPLGLHINGKFTSLGRISVSGIITKSQKFSHIYYSAICEVVYGSPMMSLIYDELFKSRSNVCFPVRPGLPPRPLVQLMWFYRIVQKPLMKIIEGHVSLPHVLKEVRSRRSYHDGMRLDKQSIQEIVSGSFSPSRSVAYLGNTALKATPDSVNVPVNIRSHHLTDNLLLIQFLSDLHKGLFAFTEYLKHLTGSLASISADLDCLINQLCWMLGVERNSRFVYGVPTTYIRSNDQLLKKLGHLIQQWNISPQIDLAADGHTHIFSIHTTDVLWEYFCLEKIRHMFKINGFVNEVIGDSEIRFSRGSELATIYYEPTIISGNSVSGVYNLDPWGKKVPDYLIRVDSSKGTRIGVLDAKYSPDPDNWQARGKEIYDKYGLYLRGETGNPLDYIYALVPSTEPSSVNQQLKADSLIKYSGCLPLDLGFISLIMGVEDDGANKLLAKLILPDSLSECALTSSQ